jgi:NAD(P)H-quinone oxidoreductase subunit 4L
MTELARESMSTAPLEAFLLLAAALFAIGLYGALSQQSIVMIMMGLELMINGLVVAGAAFWFHLAPGSADGQVLVLVAITVMALEMAVGFAVVTALFRARDVDVTDGAGDLKG